MASLGHSELNSDSAVTPTSIVAKFKGTFDPWSLGKYISGQ